MAAIWAPSRISTAATGTPRPPTTRATQSAAARTDGKAATATDVDGGRTARRSVASVTRPRVPSDPMNRRVRS